MSTRLKSKTVLVTRRPEQARELAVAIEEDGGRVLFAPMIEIVDPPSWEACDRALERLAAYDALAFASANAVDRFFSRCRERGTDTAPLRAHLLFAVGPATAKALVAQGFSPAELPDAYSASGLLASLGRRPVHAMRILVPRGAEGRQELIEGLKKLGASVDPVPVYSTAAPDSEATASVVEALRASCIDVVTFASPSAVRYFLAMLPPDLLPHLLAEIPAIVIGPTTAEAARSSGWKHVAVSRTATAAGMASAVGDYFNDGNKT